MGSIRFILALTVVFSHLGIYSNYFFFNNGSDAVQLFFIISGFYMFYIYEKKYSKINSSKFYFYTNRFLRIYPIYIIVLLLTIFYALFSLKFFPNLPNSLAAFFAHYKQLSIYHSLTIIFLNIIIIGQDLLFFLKIEGSEIIFKYNSDSILRSQFMLIPQSWSISMEFIFYLLTPLFTRLKNKYLCVIILGLFIFKYIIMLNFNNHYNLNYHTIFFEINLFLMGGLAYKLLKDKIYLNNQKKLVYLLSLILIICLPYISKHILMKWFSYFLFSVSIPIIFNLFKNNKIDKVLGDLSFPIYISHFFIIELFQEFSIQNFYLKIGLILISIITFSILILKVTQPIETFRSLRLNKSKA